MSDSILYELQARYALNMAWVNAGYFDSIDLAKREIGMYREMGNTQHFRIMKVTKTEVQQHLYYPPNRQKTEMKP